MLAVAESVDISFGVLRRMSRCEADAQWAISHCAISHRVGSRLYRSVFEEARACEPKSRFRGLVIFEGMRWHYVSDPALPFFLSRLPESLAQQIVKRIKASSKGAEVLVVHFASNTYSVGVATTGSPFRWIAYGWESLPGASR